MRYSKIYKNYYLQIKVETNSKHIHKLIEDFLDFSNINNSRPKIKLYFYLDEAHFKNHNDNQNFFYRSKIKKNSSSSIYFRNTVARIIVNPKSGMVKGAIFDYRDSFKEGILDLIFIRPLYFILAHHGFFFLHASAVCKNKNCILIIGPQDSGKSTLALTFAQNGFNLLTDDKCFIKLLKHKPQLFPFPTKMGLTNRILKKYPELNKHILKDYRYGGKKRISYNSISHLNETKELRCKMIIFPRYEANSNVYAKKISKDKALDRLFKENPLLYSKKKLRKPFWTLYDIVRKTNSFELIYNDAKLDKIPEVISNILCALP